MNTRPAQDCIVHENNCATCGMNATVSELEAQLEKAREQAFIECAQIAYRWAVDADKWLHPTQPRDQMSRHTLAVMEQVARNINWDIRSTLMKRRRRVA